MIVNALLIFIDSFKKVFVLHAKLYFEINCKILISHHKTKSKNISENKHQYKRYEQIGCPWFLLMHNRFLME